METLLTSSSSIRPSMSTVDVRYLRLQLDGVLEWLGAAASDPIKGDLATIVRLCGNSLRDEISAEQESALDLVALRSARLLEQLTLTTSVLSEHNLKKFALPTSFAMEDTCVAMSTASDENSHNEEMDVEDSEHSSEQSITKVVVAMSSRPSTPTVPSATVLSTGRESPAANREEAPTVHKKSAGAKDVTYRDVLVNSTPTHDDIALNLVVLPTKAATLVHHRSVPPARASERTDINPGPEKVKALPQKSRERATRKRVVVNSDVAWENDSKFAPLHIESPTSTDNESSDILWHGSAQKPQRTPSMLTTKRNVAERRKGASQRRRRDRELSDDMLLDAAIQRNTEYQQSNSSDVTNSLLSVVICPPAHTATSPMPVSVNEACVRLLVMAFVTYSSARRSILAQLTPRWLPSIDSLFS
jgi:hypothetical protein